MSDERPVRRPPPLPPAMPARRPVPVVEVQADAIPQTTAVTAETPRLTRPPPVSVGREWRPLPKPALLRDAPGRDDTFGGMLEPPREGLLTSRLAWVGVIGWGFIMVMILLVVQPTESIVKLTGPFKQTISAGQLGPLIAVFAILAVLVAVAGGFWMWLAMSKDYEPPADDAMTG